MLPNGASCVGVASTHGKETIAADAQFRGRGDAWLVRVLFGGWELTGRFFIGFQRSTVRCRFSDGSVLRGKRTSDTEQCGSFRPVAAEFPEIEPIRLHFAYGPVVPGVGLGLIPDVPLRPGQNKPFGHAPSGGEFH